MANCQCANKKHASGCVIPADSGHEKIKSLCLYCRKGCNRRAEATKDNTVIFRS